MSELHRRIKRIREIGEDITALSKESKAIRFSLMDEYESLPKARDGVTALVVVSGLGPLGTLVGIKPVRKDDDDPESPIADVTVVFDAVGIVGNGGRES